MVKNYKLKNDLSSTERKIQNRERNTVTGEEKLWFPKIKVKNKKTKIELPASIPDFSNRYKTHRQTGVQHWQNVIVELTSFQTKTALQK